jgi:hypothetical protein
MSAPYDGYAGAFAELAADNAANAYYDRPAVLGLLGDVELPPLCRRFPNLV